MNNFYPFKLLAISMLMAFSANSYARDYIIYSISQDFPMGAPQEVLKKNFFVNIGKKQGVLAGTTLEVFRAITQNDPYKDKHSYHHSVKIGELRVIHSEDENAISMFHTELASAADTPQLEIAKFMIGDKITVKVKD